MAEVKPVLVEVVGVHPVYARLLMVEISLDPVPSKRWIEMFNEFDGASLQRDHFAPVAKGDAILVTPPDGEMETYVQAVERRIRHVNKRIVDEVASTTPPGQRAARVSQAIAQEAFSADIRDRIMAARKAAANMSGVFQSSS